jgi:hypothetical protein
MERAPRMPDRRSRTRGRGMPPGLPSILLPLAAHFLFQWTFLAAEGLERSAEASHFRTANGFAAKAAAYRYAYEWRHGMVGRWPLFVPGFFAVAIGTAVRSRGRPVRGLIAESIAVMSAATLAAKAVAHIGTRHLVGVFERDSGLRCEATPRGSTWAGAGTGALTAGSWSALVIATQRAVATKSLWPLLLPLSLYALLASLRRGQLGSLVVPWLRRALRRDWTALGSLALAAAMTVVLWRHASRSPDVRP